MVSSNDDIFGVNPFRIFVPVGATAAYFMDSVAGEKAITIKYVSGGTLEILEAVNGTTMSGTTLLAVSGTGYLMGNSEVITFDGPTRMYLSCLGATTLLMSIRGKSAGT